jgi:outer membrane protease
LKFKKTNVSIGQDEDHMITRIIVYDLIVDQPSYEIISSVTYKLTPRAKFKSNSFSDYGIFKEVVRKSK